MNEMSWFKCVRTFLRDLKRSGSSSPSALQLEKLHVETFQSDEDSILENIDPIWNFISVDEHLEEIHGAEVLLSDPKSAQHCSNYVSSLLVNWSTALSHQATVQLQITRQEL